MLIFTQAYLHVVQSVKAYNLLHTTTVSKVLVGWIFSSFRFAISHLLCI